MKKPKPLFMVCRTGADGLPEYLEEVIVRPGGPETVWHFEAKKAKRFVELEAQAHASRSNAIVTPVEDWTSTG